MLPPATGGSGYTRPEPPVLLWRLATGHPADQLSNTLIDASP
jgi:hypothetical protein